MNPTSAPSAIRQTASERLFVANTLGRGMSVRRSPASTEILRMWPEGAMMEGLGVQQDAYGWTWTQVRDPDGGVGWIQANFLAQAANAPISANSSVAATMVPTRVSAPAGGPSAVAPTVVPTRGVPGFGQAGAPSIARAPSTPAAVATRAPTPVEQAVDGRLAAALRELKGLPDLGAPLYAVFDESKASLVVGALAKGTVASYRPSSNVITVNAIHLGESPRVLATILAHEIRHIGQAFSHRSLTRGPTGCGVAELEALQTEIVVWQAFWGGYGPNNTDLERMENEQLRAWNQSGTDALAGIIARDYGRQCGWAS